MLLIGEETWWLSVPNPDYKIEGRDVEYYSMFLKGERVSLELPHLKVQVKEQGPVLDYTETSTRTVPIVSLRLKQALEKITRDEVEFIAVEVAGMTAEQRVQHGEFFIMNVCKQVECLDPARSMVTYYPDDNYGGKDAGKISMIYRLVLDPTRIVGDEHIFRLPEYPFVIIVSEKVRDIVLENNYTGMRFVIDRLEGLFDE